MFGNEVKVGQAVTSMNGDSETPVGAAGWLLSSGCASVWGRDSLPSRTLAVQGGGKGEGIQAEPRGLLVEAMEPTVHGDRVGELVEETVQEERCIERGPEVGRGSSQALRVLTSRTTQSGAGTRPGHQMGEEMRWGEGHRSAQDTGSSPSATGLGVENN